MKKLLSLHLADFLLHMFHKKDERFITNLPDKIKKTLVQPD